MVSRRIASACQSALKVLFQDSLVIQDALLSAERTPLRSISTLADILSFHPIHTVHNNSSTLPNAPRWHPACANYHGRHCSTAMPGWHVRQFCSDSSDGRSDLEDALSEVIDQVQSLVAEGRCDEAEMALKECLEVTETSLGPTSFEALSLQQFLSIVQFIGGKFADACESGVKCLDATVAAFGEDAEESLIARLRLGASLLANRDLTTASYHLARTLRVLTTVYDSNSKMYGEALYYDALCRVAEASRIDDVAAAEEQLLRGMAAMERELGSNHMLLLTALQQYSRIMFFTIDDADARRAAELGDAQFDQIARLHAVAGATVENQSLVLYQHATFLFTLDKLDKARDKADKSLQMLVSVNTPNDDLSIQLRRHRLAMIDVAQPYDDSASQQTQQRLSTACRTLKDIMDRYSHKLGDMENPVSSEALFGWGLGMHRLAKMDDKEDDEAMHAMRRGIHDLTNVIGAEHMLVACARTLFETHVGEI